MSVSFISAVAVEWSASDPRSDSQRGLRGRLCRFLAMLWRSHWCRWAFLLLSHYHIPMNQNVVGWGWCLTLALQTWVPNNSSNVDRGTRDKRVVQTCEAWTPIRDSNISYHLQLVSNIIRFLAFNPECKKWFVWIWINLQDLIAHLN